METKTLFLKTILCNLLKSLQQINIKIVQFRLKKKFNIKKNLINLNYSKNFNKFAWITNTKTQLINKVNMIYIFNIYFL
jgi:hypothetical protein